MADRVEYRKTVSFGNYQNETIGVTLDVPEGMGTTEALATAVEWVHSQLAIHESKRQDDFDREQTIACEQSNLDRIRRDIIFEKKKWEKIKAFMEKLGVPSDHFGDVPF